MCAVNDDNIAIWRCDDNGDNKINISELVYIDCGEEKNHLRLCTFDSDNTSKIELGTIGPVSSNWWSSYSNDIEYINLLSRCGNIKFKYDKTPPECGLLNISFQVNDNNNTCLYEINTALRGKRYNLLDESDNIISDDD